MKIRSAASAALLSALGQREPAETNYFVSAPHPLLRSTDRSSLPALRQTKIHFELE